MDIESRHCQASVKRILLKLSGQALMGDDPSALSARPSCGWWHEVAEVVEPGRANSPSSSAAATSSAASPGSVGMDRATADYMGMLATVINALALSDAMRQQGLVARVMSAIAIEQVVEPDVRPKAMQYLEEGKVVIFAAGTGNPSSPPTPPRRCAAPRSAPRWC